MYTQARTKYQGHFFFFPPPELRQKTGVLKTAKTWGPLISLLWSALKMLRNGDQVMNCKKQGGEI